MMFCCRWLAASCLFVFLLPSASIRAAEPAATPEVKSPLDPAAAQKLFQLADSSLQIELATAEPEVIDPVAIRFDEDGRMWVAEMRDYPLGPPAGSTKHSRIRVLEDADGDGRFEKATTFADGLSFVTGLQPWKGGVFVTLGGAVAYMKDTDGDGKCDLDETWFEGFAEQNTQLRANHPRLALDNWIYVANGLRGGKVVSRKLKDQKPIDISGMDFRFDPLTGKAEAVSGNGQFGLTFDDWGNRFICSNRNPCMHVVIEDRYLKANPGVTVPAVVHNVAAFAEKSRIYPISRAWTTSNLHAGQFTAACGVYIYRGDLLPKEFYGNVFTCDPTGNLVHREIMQPAGPTFTSKPAYEGKEFLASPDEWFRPVNMELGPDGALYVVDMYRCVIEHPDFVPDELKNRPDQRLGDDRGRIWRIVPANTNPTRKRGTVPHLSQATSNDLIALLGHPNAWQRETAQRQLLGKSDPGIAVGLASASSDNLDARKRLHALWSRSALNILSSADVIAALRDVDPRVRKHAILLAERTADRDKLAPRLDARLSDEDAIVRFQARLSASGFGRYRGDSIVRLSDIDNSWLGLSIILAIRPDDAARVQTNYLRELPKELSEPSPAALAMIESLCELGIRTEHHTGREAIFAAAIAALDREQPMSVGLAALKGIGRGLPRLEASPRDALLRRFGTALTEKLVSIARSAELPSTLRQDSILVLALCTNAVSEIAEFAQHANGPNIRLAAITALTRRPDFEPWPPLMDTFPAETPPVRRAIVDGLLANTERTKLLLDAIEAGKIKPSELDAAHVTRLNQHRDAAIKERAGKLFAAATPAERAKALADYQPVLTMQADAKRGQVIFEKNCAACHKIAGVGVNVAPDISDSRTKKLDQLLGDILLPNRAIDNNYIGYNVRLLDGTIATGILSAETSTSITLRQQGGKEAVIPRDEIDELKSSGLSLMPEGLERQIPLQEMADLLSFIKNWRYLDGRTPLSPSN